jgi:hypothetical protein
MWKLMLCVGKFDILSRPRVEVETNDEGLVQDEGAR